MLDEVVEVVEVFWTTEVVAWVVEVAWGTLDEMVAGVAALELDITEVADVEDEDVVEDDEDVEEVDEVDGVEVDDVVVAGTVNALSNTLI